MTSKIVYQGGLRCEAEHIRSGSTIQTDAPVDNMGKGALFSPTDLVATALAACILTTMGIAANAREMNIDGSDCTVEKIMAAEPRRISEVKVVITMRGQESFSDKEKSLMEHIAISCPVFVSLHPDMKKDITFIWN